MDGWEARERNDPWGGEGIRWPDRVGRMDEKRVRTYAHELLDLALLEARIELAGFGGG
jgi:hypothetical protein